MRKGGLAAALLTGVLFLAVSAAGWSATAKPTSTQAGTLSFCTDATYPPEEYFQGSKIIGSDIDIATAISKRIGMTASFKNTGFDAIIAALLAKKCDAIISGMNDTPARRKQVSFTDYLKVGQSIMVKKGNPENLTSLASLSGKSVSVESGTTDRDFLAAQSAILVKKGQKAINIKTFPKDTDAASALKAGRVDAYFGDSPVAVYYVSKDSSFQIGGSPINPILIGVAIRKGDPLKAATQKAITALYANGTMEKIVGKWGMAHAVTLLK